MTAKYNLLAEPIFTVKCRSKIFNLSLPSIIARLSSGKRIDSFEALRPHQRQPWFCFLAQLSALALLKASINSPPKSDEEWSALLRNMTPNFVEDEPWCLVVGDFRKPAFLQPALIPRPNKYSELQSPDEFDVLVTSKNHDVKCSTMRRSEPQHWVFSLITTQTLHGYPGRGYYGIARMNGGYGNRPFVSYQPSYFWYEQFISTIVTLLEKREQLKEKYEYFDFSSGIALLWVEPWDGKRSLPLKKLDPYFIEVCRRVRLTLANAGIKALLATTDAPRIDAADYKGNVGDPWAPVKSGASSNDQPSMLTVKSGFDYRLTRELIFGNDYSSLFLNNRPECKGDLLFLARTTVRGQGKTEGYHERVVNVPKNVRKMFSIKSEGIIKLAGISRQWVEDIDDLRKRCLKPALLQLAQGAPETLNFQYDKTNRFIEIFQRRVDDNFFPSLWTAANIEEEQARKSWLSFLKSEGGRILDEAKEALPLPSSRRYKAIALADSFFLGSFYKNFPMMKEAKGGEGKIA